MTTRTHLVSLLAAGLLAGCGSPPASPPPAGPPAGGTPEAQAAPQATAGQEAAAPSKEDEEAKKLAADFAEMEKQAAEHKAKMSSEEVDKAAKALVNGVYGNTKAAVEAAMKGSHRADGNAARDEARHPAETLEFFGLRANQTVLEYGPGGGWYTELLAPVLANKGQLYVTNGDPTGPRTERSTYYALRTHLFLDSSPTLYGKVLSVQGKEPEFALGIDGKIDLAIVVRGMHGMVRRDQLEPWLKSIHTALRPGGTLGIVQHRAKEGADPKQSAEQGYLPEKWLIDQIKAAGFEFVAKSEMNANPKDTADHSEGVWALPPTLRLGDQDRAKYEAIGESDRMTLKFRKAAK